MWRSMVAAILVTSIVSYPAGRVLAGRQESQANYPIVGQFEFREHRVTILSAASHQLYSIADASGTTLAANLTAEQFAEQYPLLFELLQSAIGERQSADLLMLESVAGQDSQLKAPAPFSGQK
ncbi:MAG: hypothetical protein AAFY11_13650 [Cyanobacteria bacterium J06641_5]